MTIPYVFPSPLIWYLANCLTDIVWHIGYTGKWISISLNLKGKQNSRSYGEGLNPPHCPINLLFCILWYNITTINLNFLKSLPLPYPLNIPGHANGGCSGCTHQLLALEPLPTHMCIFILYILSELHFKFNCLHYYRSGVKNFSTLHENQKNSLANLFYFHVHNINNWYKFTDDQYLPP